MLNSTRALKGHSAKHSAHALSLDILEEIFAFVPYKYCQNSWIASSKLHIPLASKLKKLRQYQDWIQKQINELDARVDAIIAERRANIAELKEMLALKPKSENCQKGIAELEQSHGMEESAK
ncbi:hypothetical protein Ddc_19887 [Ditylenchus destructor]|nr:hypothetical protein Ddc_19887 [Ditylenchus destructor]